MSQLAEGLLEEALRLPAKERSDLASKLYDSIDSQMECVDLGAEWAEEIRRRIEESDKRVVKSIPWAEAQKMIFENPNEDDETT